MALQERQKKAIDSLGGALGLLELPSEIREALASCEYEKKVELLELLAQNRKDRTMNEYADYLRTIWSDMLSEQEITDELEHEAQMLEEYVRDDCTFIS